MIYLQDVFSSEARKLSSTEWKQPLSAPDHEQILSLPRTIFLHNNLFKPWKEKTITKMKLREWGRQKRQALLVRDVQ